MPAKAANTPATASVRPSQRRRSPCIWHSANATANSNTCAARDSMDSASPGWLPSDHRLVKTK